MDDQAVQDAIGDWDAVKRALEQAVSKAAVAAENALRLIDSATADQYARSELVDGADAVYDLAQGA